MKIAIGFVVAVFAGLTSGCLKKNAELLTEANFESISKGKNAGFRILPQTAARDPMRPLVIYRCNDVQCGEAFQPSNEERDLFIPCEAVLGTSPQTIVKPFMRLVGEGAKRALIEKDAHKKACEQAMAFDKLVAEPPPSSQPVVQGAPTCRVFKRDQVACESNAALGCRWVTHPSRNGDPTGGECVAAVRGSGAPQTDPNLPGNVQTLSGSKPPAVWSDINAYRPPAPNAPASLK